MKKFLIYILIILALGFGAYKFKGKIPEEIKTYIAPAGPCDEPFRYAIGNVDLQFGISRDKLIEDAKQAQNIWDAQVGKDLLEYDPDAPLKINLVFDERQEQTLEIETLEQKLQKLKITNSSLQKQYDALYSDYSKKVDAYNSLAKKYEKKLESYNKDVDYWNQQGGAPPNEYDKLQKEQDDLKSISKDLEKKRKEINNLSAKINALVKQENKIADNYNAAINTYQSKYGSSREFEKGVYNGEEINIYQFKEESDLELTIAHELGHALGIDHVENPQSLMYYLLSEQDMDAPSLTSEDMNAIEAVCQ